MDAALKDLHHRKFKSVNAITKAFNVAEATLRARWKGRKSRAQANEMKQTLSEAEENALIRWILKLAKSEYPLDKLQLQEIAEEMYQKCISIINDVYIVLVEYSHLALNRWTNSSTDIFS